MDEIKIKQAWPGLVAVLMILNAGCRSVGPDYVTPQVAVPEAWQGSAGEFSDTMSQWWTVFGDPALAGLVADARANNRDLAAAMARLEGYTASLGMARADVFPSVGAEGTVAYDRQTERVHTPKGYAATDNPHWLQQAGFSMSWELDLWGRVRRNVEAAQGALDASWEDVRNVQVILQAQVAVAYIQLRTLQQQVAFAERNIELQQETLTVVRGRFEAGLTGELDVRQAEMNLAATTAQVPSMKAGIEQALNGLCQLTGRLPGELDALRTAGPVPMATALPGFLPVELLRRRPDIRSAERQLAAQTAKIGVAQADYYPQLALNGTFALAATDIGEFGKKASQVYGIGPSLTWAIFTAGKVRNHVRAEEAAARVTLAAYEQSVLGAYRECEDALAALANEKARLTALGDAVTAAEQTAGLVDELYRTGLRDFQGVLDAQRQLAQYQDALAQSMGKSAMDLVAAYKAFGGGWATEGGVVELAPPEAEKNNTDVETPEA